MIVVKKTDNPNFLQLEAEKSIMNFLQMHFTVRDKNAYFSPMYRSHKWDGKIRFLHANGTLLSGLLVEVLRIAKINKWQIEFDKNLILNPLKITRDEINLALKDVTLFPDQVDVIEKMLKYRIGLCKLPTSSGKSYIEIAIMNLMRLKGVKDMILIVPRQTLVEQIYDDLITKSPFIKPEEVGRLYGGKKEWDRPVVVATWQSLNTLLELDEDYGKRFEVLIQDEVHCSSSQAKTTRKVITSFNVKYKYGFSATIISKDSDKLEYFNSVGLFGPITATGNIQQLQDIDRISDAEIRIKLLKYPMQPEIRDYKAYEDFIRYNPSRREYIINLVKQIKKEIPRSNGLLLIRNVDFAQEMAEMLKEYFGIGVHLMDGSTKIEKRIKIKETIKKNKNQILAATVGVFSIGENVPNLHWLILVQARKSEIETIQQVGRLLRIFPGKEKAIIYDITDNLTVIKTKEDGSIVKKNFGKKHLKNRIEVFRRHGLEITNMEEVFL
jgi:superfamily II DNA or RNA helicase